MGTRTLAIMLLLSSEAYGQGMTADQILKKTDEIRSPTGSYMMKVKVESSDGTDFKFEIAIGGKDSSIIRTVEPKREVGKNFLMLGEDMWAFIPNIKRSVRVSLNQKLTGQAANGDVSRMRWQGDYRPTIEAETNKQWQLSLRALRKGLTYERMRIWVRKSDFRPVRGEYLTKSGQLIKTIEFAEFGKLAGALRPTKMIIRKAGDESDYSVLLTEEMKERDFSSSYFSQESLK